MQYLKIELFTAAGALLGNMAKGMTEGLSLIIQDMLAKSAREWIKKVVLVVLVNGN